MSGGASDQLRFIRGTDQHGAKPPAGFPLRFAVLTWCTRDGEGAEPWALLKLAVPEIARLVGAEAVRTEEWELRRRFGFWLRPRKVSEQEWRTLATRDDADLHEHAALPTKLRFERNGAVILWLESRNWHAGGGPAPYHDSCELSFFSAEDRAEELEQIFRQAAPAVGATLRV